MGRYARFGLTGCGGLLLLFFVLMVGIFIGGSGSSDSAIEDNEAEQDVASEEAPSSEPAEVEPVEFSGTGSQATDDFPLPAGLVRFGLIHEGESNFIVYLLDEYGNESLVLSEIGAGTFSQALQVPEDGNYLLNVEAADGPWTISVS